MRSSITAIFLLIFSVALLAPYLVWFKGDDAQLKTLAAGELEVQPDTLTLGDGWWNMASALEPERQIVAKERALQHYRAILPSLVGSNKTRVAKIVEQAEQEQNEQQPTNEVDLIRLLKTPDSHATLPGRWRINGTKVTTTNMLKESFISPPFKPPSEYDLLVEVSRTRDGKKGSDTHIRIPRGDATYTFGIRTPKQGPTQLSFWGDRTFGQLPMGVTLNRRFALNEKHAILFRVRGSGIQVILDGKPQFMTRSFSQLRRSNQGLGLGSFQNASVFHQYRVEPVKAKSARRPARSKTPVDLLKQMDLQRDALERGFQLESGYLQTPVYRPNKSGMDRIKLPLENVPAQYDVELIVERLSDKGYGLNFGFLMNGTRGQIVMDGYRPSGWAIAYVNTVRGPMNPTFARGRRLALNEKTAVQIRVRRGRVVVQCNGETVIDWTGRPSQLSVDRKFDIPQQDVMFLGSQSLFRVHQLKLVPK